MRSGVAPANGSIMTSNQWQLWRKEYYRIGTDLLDFFDDAKEFYDSLLFYCCCVLPAYSASRIVA